MSEVAKLVPLARELCFDNTMDEVRAVLRMDAKLEDNKTNAQFLIDFRHKKDMRKSRPRFYGTISSPRQFEDLVTMSLAIACFHSLQNRVDPSSDEILCKIHEIIKWKKDDVRHLVQLLAKDVKIRRAQLLLGALKE